MKPPQINLVLAWAGILLGFLSGLAFGLSFHREDWLGGYTSFRRRLYRLAHISFFGLAAVNLFFYLTVHALTVSSAIVSFASWAFIVGAVSMPACCLVVAHRPRGRMLFAVPVLSLVAGGAVILLEVIKL
jgi:hypothetical protein